MPLAEAEGGQLPKRFSFKIVTTNQVALGVFQ